MDGVYRLKPAKGSVSSDPIITSETQPPRAENSLLIRTAVT